MWQSLQRRFRFRSCSPQWCSCDSGNDSLGNCPAQASHLRVRTFASHARQVRVVPENISALLVSEQVWQMWHSLQRRFAFWDFQLCSCEPENDSWGSRLSHEEHMCRTFSRS